jgi:hypothetical protein
MDENRDQPQTQRDVRWLSRRTARVLMWRAFWRTRGADRAIKQFLMNPAQS